MAVRLVAVGAACAFLAACQSAPGPASPGTDGGAPDAITRYGCSDGQALSAAFFRARSEAVVTRGGGFRVALPDRRPESGVWFANDAYELRGQGPEVTFGRVGEDAVVCRAVG